MQYRLLETKISRIDFVNELTQPGQVDLSANYHTDVSVNADDKRMILAEAQFDMSGKQAADDNSFLKIELNIAGVFEASEEVAEDSVDENVFHAMIFPYVRAYIATITALSGLSTITLPDMTAANKSEETK